MGSVAKPPKPVEPPHERERNPVSHVVREQQRVRQIVVRQAAHTARRLNATLARFGL